MNLMSKSYDFNDSFGHSRSLTPVGRTESFLALNQPKKIGLPVTRNYLHGHLTEDDLPLIQSKDRAA